MTDRLRAADIVRALGGKPRGNRGEARCPAHSDRNPSLFIKDGEHGLILKCMAGCSTEEVVNALRALRLWPEHNGPIQEPTQAEKEKLRKAKETFEEEEVHDDARKRALCAKLWGEAVHAIGSPIEAWLRVRRINLPRQDLGRLPLRWHPRCSRGPSHVPAMLALMSDAQTNQATGLHRTYLTPDGSAKAFSEKPRMMLGRAGIIRLSPDDTVSEGLGICEGIETGLALMAAGWRPIWACGSLDALKQFPVLDGIECLTVFADPKPHEIAAAITCGARWADADREVVVKEPGPGGDFNDTLG